MSNLIQVPGKVDRSTGHQKIHQFRVGHRYEKLTAIGEGAYGVVVSALDSTKPAGEQERAIKKIILQDPNGPPIMPKQALVYFQSTLREVKILKKLKHENIISIEHAYRLTEDGKNLKEIYLIQDLMGPDLYKLIHVLKSPLSAEHIQFFVYQILRGIKFIHSANVIHRDLKSQNILVNSNCDLKICDFGMARVVDSQAANSAQGKLTEYVCTRWYRAPEIVVDPRNYTKAVDIWSIGCIVGEMLGRKVLFAGKDYIDQMNLIFQALGKPSQEDMNEIANASAKEYIEKMNFPPRQKLGFEGCDPEACDLMDKLLLFNPRKRIEVGEALKHPYVGQYYYPEDEPVALEPFNVNDELNELNQQQLLELLHNETEAL